MTDQIPATAVPRYVEFFRRFLTHEALSDALLAEQHRFKKRGFLHMASVWDKQPLLRLFRHYDKLTLKGARVPRIWPDEVLHLAFMGQMVASVVRGMPESVQRDHRDKMLSLDGQHRPVAHEWHHAYHFARRGWPVDWYGTNTSAPEFKVTSPHGAFDVECTRFGPNVFEHLKDSEANEIFEAIFSSFSEARLCGDITVRCLVAKPEPAASWLSEFVGALRGSNITFRWELPGQLLVSGTTYLPGKPAPDIPNAASHLELKPPDARCRSVGWEANGVPVGTLRVLLFGPRMSPSEQLEYVWNRMREKAGSKKFNGHMPAVLAVEFDGVDDADVFIQSQGIQEIHDRLFSQLPYLVALTFRGNHTYRSDAVSVQGFSTAFSVTSNVSRFPKVAAIDF